MESEQVGKKDVMMQVEVETDQTAAAPVSGGLTRQLSVTKTTCLCSPTKHAGSFRCRFHRTPSLQRSKSIDAAAKPADSTTT